MKKTKALNKLQDDIGINKNCVILQSILRITKAMYNKAEKGS